MRVLVIDGAEQARLALKIQLESEGHEVDEASNGRTGEILGASGAYDLVVLELDLPDMSGFGVLNSLTTKVSTPIIVLTERTGIEDEVRAITGGADDYIKKPYHKDVLVARISAIQRRTNRRSQPLAVRAGDVAVDIANQLVEVKGKRVHLTRREMEMLSFIAQRKGTTVSAQQVLDHVYPGPAKPQLNTVTSNIFRMRMKLNKGGAHRNLIEHIKDVGYMLRDPE